MSEDPGMGSRTSLLAAVVVVVAWVTPAAAVAVPTTPRLSVYAGSGSGTPVAGPAVDSPLGMVFRAAAAPDGTLFLPDLTHRVIAKVTPAGDLSVIAGTSGVAGAPTEGPARDSLIGTILGSATDRLGNLYVYDSSARRILKIDTAGQLTFVAGTGTSAMPTTPLGPDARSTPLATGGALTVDATGNVYFADTTRYQILKITPAGLISAVAGLGGGVDGAFAEGPALSSPMDPLGLAAAPDGSLYVSNRVDRRIARIDPSGTLSSFAGDGTNDPLEEGPRLTSSAHQPTNLQLEDDGDLLFTDSTSALIAKVTPAGTIVKVAGKGTAGGGGAAFSGDDPFTNEVSNWSLAAVGDGRFFISGPSGVARIGRPEPAAATNLTAVDGINEFTVAFDAPADSGSAPVTAWEVSTDDGASWAPLPVSNQLGLGRRAVVARAGGTSYQVRVRATNSYGAGVASAAVAARPSVPAVADPDTPEVTSPAPTSPTPATAAPSVPVIAAPAAPTTPARTTCRATRTVRLSWIVPRHTRVVRQRVSVNGHVTRLAPGSRTVAVTLDSAIARTATVKVTARTTTGRLLSTTRHYRLCAPRTRGTLDTTVLKPAR